MTPADLVALIALPIGLTEPCLAELAALWTQFAPRDAFERLLVKRILQAAARLELSAQRETEQPDALWLRYESAADRLFRQSLTALERHRREHPVDATAPDVPVSPAMSNDLSHTRPGPPPPQATPAQSGRQSPARRTMPSSLEQELLQLLRDPHLGLAALADPSLIPIAINPDPSSPLAPSSG